MEQKKLAAYLGLIQDLLSCPQGEEWIHLKRHEALVDAQFVQVMEQVAAQLGRQGNPEADTFLHNWAAQLHHIFFKEVQPPSSEDNSSDAYLDFIEKLLSCPEGLEEELIVEHKSLIGPGLVHKMREIARQLRAQQEMATALFLEKFASQLNQVWIREHNFQTHLQKIPTAKASGRKTMAEKAVAEKAVAEKSEAAKAVVDRDLREVSMVPDMWKQVDEMTDPWGSDSANEMATPETVSVDDAELRETPQSVSITDSATDSVIELPAISLEPQGSQAIAAGLNAIAVALQQLTQTLSSDKTPQSTASRQHPEPAGDSAPLAHLEALERAHDANWQLTTEEVEKLIGVRPRCHEKETVYQRGNWRFTKVGQLGSQTAWQVSKVSY